MPESLPREEFTSIEIDSRGNWFAAAGRPIINPRILSYFKENLNRDDRGIFILNRFGELSEKGYIIVKGPVLFVEEVDAEGCLLETGEKIAADRARIVFDEKEVPHLHLPALGAWAGFRRHAAAQLGQFLRESGEELTLFGLPLHHGKIDWI